MIPDQRVIRVDVPLSPEEEASRDKALSKKARKRLGKLRKKQLKKFSQKAVKKIKKLPPGVDDDQKKQLKAIRRVQDVTQSIDFDEFQEFWNNKWSQVAEINARLHQTLATRAETLRTVEREKVSIHEQYLYERTRSNRLEADVMLLKRSFFIVVAIFAVVIAALVMLISTYNIDLR